MVHTPEANTGGPRVQSQPCLKRLYKSADTLSFQLVETPDAPAAVPQGAPGKEATDAQPRPAQMALHAWHIL